MPLKDVCILNNWNHHLCKLWEPGHHAYGTCCMCCLYTLDKTNRKWTVILTLVILWKDTRHQKRLITLFKPGAWRSHSFSLQHVELKMVLWIQKPFVSGTFFSIDVFYIVSTVNVVYGNPYNFIGWLLGSETCLPNFFILNGHWKNPNWTEKKSGNGIVQMVTCHMAFDNKWIKL